MSDYPPRLPGRVAGGGLSINDIVFVLLVIGGIALLLFGGQTVHDAGVALIFFGLGIYSDRAR